MAYLQPVGWVKWKRNQVLNFRCLITWNPELMRRFCLWMYETGQAKAKEWQGEVSSQQCSTDACGSGFNGGARYAANIDLSIAVWNTNVCAAKSLLVWTTLDVVYFGKPSLIEAVQGMMTGLVCITTKQVCIFNIKISSLKWIIDVITWVWDTDGAIVGGYSNENAIMNHSLGVHELLCEFRWENLILNFI